MATRIKPESRTAAKSFWVGVVGVGVIAAVMWLTFAAQYGAPFVPKSSVKVAFKDVDALQVKDPVRQNSKGIGRVIDISYGDSEAILTLQIELGGDYQVYKNATASIQDQSAVGAKFVEFSPGTQDAGLLEPGGVIPQTQTTSSRDVYQTLSIFDEKTRAAATGFLSEFGGGLADQATNFKDFVGQGRDTLMDLGTLSKALSSPQADLPKLFATSERLASRFTGRERQISSLIDQTDQTFNAINVDGGKPLAELLDRLPGALDEVKPALDSLNVPLADTRGFAVDFERGATGLGRSEDDLRGAFRESVPVLDDVPSVSGKTTPAFEDLTPAFNDAAKVTPRGRDALNMFATPLQKLAPYDKEFGYFFTRLRSFLAEGTADGSHYARFNAGVQGPYTFTAGILKSCNFGSNPYPKPREADTDRTSLAGLGGNVPCGIKAQPHIGGYPR